MATKPLAAHGEIGNGRADESRADNIRSTDFGTSQAYLLKRIGKLETEGLMKVEWRSATLLGAKLRPTC